MGLGCMHCGWCIVAGLGPGSGMREAAPAHRSTLSSTSFHLHFTPGEHHTGQNYLPENMGDMESLGGAVG